MKSAAKGYSLIEILVAMAIIGIIAGIAMQVFRGYLERAEMAQVTSHFEESVRYAKNRYVKNQLVLSLGQAPIVPETAAGWIRRFSVNTVTAPAGGPAFIEGTSGDPSTGAVGVSVDEETKQLTIVRPAFRELVRYQAVVSVDAIVYL